MRKKLLFVIGMLFVINIFNIFAVPKKERWDYWFAVDDLNRETIYHHEWDKLLQKYVVEKEGKKLVDYAKFTPKDKQMLGVYIRYLNGIPITQYSRSEQKAFWINLYNAITWQIILSYYPVDTIKKIHISPGSFSRGPWDKRVAIIEGYPVSLNDIEHRILRPIWNDDRIHYAINCASLGCPDIQPQAYTKENMEELLNKARTEYINSPKGVMVEGKTLRLSKIYEWFLYDFAPDEESLVLYLKKHAQGELLSQLNDWIVKGSKRIKYYYDWDLNEVFSPKK